jgi:hypothetical protein
MDKKQQIPDNRTEQRREPRETCQVAVMICGGSDGRAFEPAEMVNRSPHGVAILFPRAIDSGQTFLLKTKEQTLNVSAYAARHCRRLNATRYVIGGQLLQIIGEHAVKSD